MINYSGKSNPIIKLLITITISSNFTSNNLLTNSINYGTRNFKVSTMSNETNSSSWHLFFQDYFLYCLSIYAWAFLETSLLISIFQPCGSLCSASHKFSNILNIFLFVYLNHVFVSWKKKMSFLSVYHFVIIFRIALDLHS